MARILGSNSILQEARFLRPQRSNWTQCSGGTLQPAPRPRLPYLTPVRLGHRSLRPPARPPCHWLPRLPVFSTAQLGPVGRFYRRSRSPGGWGAAREDCAALSADPSWHVSTRGSPHRPAGPGGCQLGGGLRQPCSGHVVAGGAPHSPGATATASRRREARGFPRRR